MFAGVRLRAFILSAAFILDLIIGDPGWWPHPVVYIGKLIKAVEDGLFHMFSLGSGQEEDKGRKLFAGALLWLFTAAVSTAIPWLAVFILRRLNKWAGLALEILLCSQLLAARSLFAESMKVYRALKSGDREAARLAVSMIVGRDTDRLDEEGMIRATVETVAENTSDGVTAPIFWYVLFGLPGIFLYKAANTLDSMVGYRNERYLYFGRVSARIDDLLNFIPARITGFLMGFAAGAAGFDMRKSLRIFIRDRKNHASPNSAHTEAAMAGALGIRLGGDAWYFGRLYKKPVIGDDLRPPVAEDIRNANKIMLTTAVISWLIGVLAPLMAFYV